MHQSVSIRKQGYQSLLFYIAQIQGDKTHESLSLATKILDVVFVGLNDENEQICKYSSEIFKILPNTYVIQLNLRLFCLKMHLILNTNFLDNRRYIYEAVNQAHVRFLDVSFIKDTISGMEIPTTEEKAIELCIWILVQHKSKQSAIMEQTNQQLDYFTIQHGFAEYDIDEIIQKLVHYIVKNKILIDQQPMQLDELSQKRENVYYITNYKYLQILLYMKDLYKGQDKEELFQIGKYLALPQYDYDIATQFNKSAYLYLLTGQQQFIKQTLFTSNSMFQFNQQKQSIQEQVNTEQFLEELAEQIDDKSPISDAILDLLLANKISHYYLKQFQQKYEILHQCMFFEPQQYFEEICKQVIKNGRQEQIMNLIQQLQQLEVQYEMNGKDFNIQSGKFNSLKIRDTVVSANKILQERFGQYGFIAKFCQQYSDNK